LGRLAGPGIDTPTAALLSVFRVVVALTTIEVDVGSFVATAHGE
jgi:hypothetical protein